MSVAGFLTSQIGYDLKDPKRALIRSDERHYLEDGLPFELLTAEGTRMAFQGEVRYWGEKWGIHWWELDFTACETEGQYRIRLPRQDRECLESDYFKIGYAILWQESVHKVAILQLEERAKLSRNGKGWKDCGSVWREANSHASMLVGLCDLLNIGFEWLDEDQQTRLAAQMVIGCDYLAACQDKAEQIGFPTGAIVHEIPNHTVIIPGDVAQSAVALAMASRLLYERYPEKSGEYLRRATAAFDYLMNQAKPYGGSGFSHSNHGAPEGYVVPDEFMTRDLLMMQWAAVELCAAGKIGYMEDAVRLARQTMRRQVTEDATEDGYYGHFYTFSDRVFTEKANIHHHVGHDTGGSFPFYIVPFLEMRNRWYDHPDAALWDRTIERFAYGYLLPACMENPFRLIPMGYFHGEGILNFCGPWHGINTSIGYAASLSARLEARFGDRAFREIAVGNIQWIAGLHAGITRESLEGSLFWKEAIPDGIALSYSQIYGVGSRYTGNWTGIVGTIPNGFSVNPQFQLTVKPSKEADGPRLYTDEDWIPHAGGWLSALSWLRDVKRYADLPGEENKH